MTSKILVTGAAGLLGTALLKAAPDDSQVDATFFHQLLAAEPTGKGIRIDFAIASLVQRLFEQNHYDLIVNCAGASDVDRCELDREYAQQANVTVARNLAEAAARQNARLIHISSDYVFDGAQGPYDESGKPNPINLYGKSKWEAEQAAAKANRRTTIVRVCSLYTTDLKAPRNLYRGIAETLLAGRIYRAAEDISGNPTEVTDLARAIWKLTAQPVLRKVLHLAAPEFISRYDFAIQVVKRIGVDESLLKRVKLSTLELPAARPKRAGLKSEIAYSLLGGPLRTLGEIERVAADQSEEESQIT